MNTCGQEAQYIYGQWDCYLKAQKFMSPDHSFCSVCTTLRVWERDKYLLPDIFPFTNRIHSNPWSAFFSSRTLLQLHLTEKMETLLPCKLRMRLCQPLFFIKDCVIYLYFDTWGVSLWSSLEDHSICHCWEKPVMLNSQEDWDKYSTTMHLKEAASNVVTCGSTDFKMFSNHN